MPRHLTNLINEPIPTFTRGIIAFIRIECPACHADLDEVSYHQDSTGVWHPMLDERFIKCDCGELVEALILRPMPSDTSFRKKK